MITFDEAKKNLSKYIDFVISEHESIVICRNGKPVVKLVEYCSQRKKIKFGLLRGKIKIKTGFNQLPDDFMEHFA